MKNYLKNLSIYNLLQKADFNEKSRKLWSKKIIEHFKTIYENGYKIWW